MKIIAPILYKRLEAECKKSLSSYSELHTVGERFSLIDYRCRKLEDSKWKFDFLFHISTPIKAFQKGQVKIGFPGVMLESVSFSLMKKKDRNSYCQKNNAGYYKNNSFFPFFGCTFPPDFLLATCCCNDNGYSKNW